MNWKKLGTTHCINIVRIQSYSALYFPTFGPNTERFGVFPYSFQMQGSTDHNNSKYGHFSSSDSLRPKLKNLNFESIHELGKLLS